MNDNVGDWRGLAHQSARYAIIATRLRGCRSVLDIGCGEGHLMDYLPGVDYVGVDVSPSAIAAAKTSRRGEFICANAMEWVTHEKFDAVVFNESLYYFQSFYDALHRAAKWLSNGKGRIVVSVWKHHRWMAPNWRALMVAKSFLRMHSNFSHAVLIQDGLRWDIVDGHSSI